jgi:hypothetical protein
MAENKQREAEDWTWSESGDVEIPNEEWERFLESFSNQHQGWLASVVKIADQQASMQAIACRLLRITSEPSQIRLSMECEGGKPQQDLVRNPERLIFKRDEQGAHQGLDLVASDGSMTSLRFRSAARPETLDGVVTPMRTR